MCNEAFHWHCKKDAEKVLNYINKRIEELRYVKSNRRDDQIYQ